MWGVVDDLVAALIVLLAPKVLDDGPDARALGMPVDQAGARSSWKLNRSSSLPRLRWSRFLDLLQPGQVLSQLLLGGPDRAIDALQHRLVLVAAPVGAGHVQQLEGVPRDLARVLQVWAAAQVRKVAVRVDRQLSDRLGAGLAMLVLLARGQLLDLVDLVGLVGEHRLGLVHADVAVLEGILALDDLFIRSSISARSSGVSGRGRSKS